jgi:hypothetical protein
MKKSHQHFIPRTYLKNFSHTNKKGTYLVDAYDVSSKQYKENISTYALCAETDLYTINHLNNENKYILEDFYSQKIESRFPSIYNLLVKQKPKDITTEQKVQILYTILSMYFRTPKVLNKFSEFSSRLIERINTKNEHQTIDFLGYKISIKDKSFDDIKKEIKEKNRINFLKTQLALLHKFVEFKLTHGLVVIELIGDQEFITGDNPIQIGDDLNQSLGLFSSENSIYVPLDPKHALFIAPGNIEASINEIYYQRDNFFLHIVLNSQTFRNAERWIIGTKKGLTQFIEEIYSEPVDNNHPIPLRMKNKLEIMQNILQLMEKDLSNNNLKLIEAFAELKLTDIYNDVDIQDLFNKLKKNGLNI